MQNTNGTPLEALSVVVSAVFFLFVVPTISGIVFLIKWTLLGIAFFGAANSALTMMPPTLSNAAAEGLTTLSVSGFQTIANAWEFVLAAFAFLWIWRIRTAATASARDAAMTKAAVVALLTYFNFATTDRVADEIRESGFWGMMKSSLIRSVMYRWLLGPGFDDPLLTTRPVRDSTGARFENDVRAIVRDEIGKLATR